MTQEQARQAIRRMIQERTAEICMSRESAIAYLRQLGTHDAQGNLTRQYGGN